ncbi:hypothetical protein ANOM_007283 [Aspergillus nomiae NRRL 13137]|uniref:Uncharacterized protein n=1 Tax=Aspergillus nomiae NRRL (strain ATCC 15546 / NRRL 13137 / CBS 260.88 / M93) TaxID=1509407 RepID=A0A0L1IXS7_ASPN3|nr:uncharacterized protein ANOM_007283 [Aspergillus nomiae NRRL 13137]KNG84220.1 hypothetical protein ANOM_007283 [Aspergillus nomiae NRRL 13137]
MSLPKHTTSSSLSSSPSKQSIRRTTESNVPSRPESTIDRPTTAQQTHAFSQEQQAYEPITNVTSPHSENDGPHEISASHPPLQPFFTLIEDASTSEYYHPTVHYIFSDDDTDIMTEAALRSLEPEQNTHPHGDKGNSRTTRDQHPQGEGGVDDELSNERKESLLPPPIPGVRDNYIILDMDVLGPDDMQHMNSTPGHDVSVGSPGTQSSVPQQQQDSQNNNQHGQKFAVTSAYSLTPTWQVLNTQLVPAPTFENNPSGEHSPNGALMLKIQGTVGLPMTLPGKDKEKDNSTQRLEDMMEQFSKRLGELRQVIEAGEQAHLPGNADEEHIPTELPNTEDTAVTSPEGQNQALTQNGDDMVGKSP